MHAAGGVVVRQGPEGVEVLVVHRPRYDDWSLPKGKVDPGESGEEAAVREVEEETGWRCSPGEELPAVRYRDRVGREKVVRYFRMAPETFGGFRPNDEIDATLWLTPARAATMLTYDADRRLVQRIEDGS